VVRGGGLFVSNGELQNCHGGLRLMAVIHFQWLLVGEIWVCVTRSKFPDACVSYGVCNLPTLGFRWLLSLIRDRCEVVLVFVVQMSKLWCVLTQIGVMTLRSIEWF